MNGAATQFGRQPAALAASDRLLLRPLRPEDETLYCDLYADGQTMRHIGVPLSLERAARAFRRVLRTGKARTTTRLIVCIELRATGEAIGICGLQGLDQHTRRIEAGIMLTAPARGKGYSEEALQGAVQLAFDVFPVEEVWTRIAVGHSIAERMVQAIGFAPIGQDAPGLQPQSGIRTWTYRRNGTAMRAGKKTTIETAIQDHGSPERTL